MLEQFKESAAFIQSRTNVKPTIGIILGTGLGGLVKEIHVIDEIPYEQIPNFPISTVESHSGKLIFGELGGKQVVAMQGRFHYYEGYSLQQEKAVLMTALPCLLILVGLPEHLWQNLDLLQIISFS